MSTPSTHSAETAAHGRSHGELQAPIFMGAVVPLSSDTEAGYLDDGMEAKSGSFFGRFGLFIGLVALPLLIASLYFGLIAADLYVSETKFIVRTSSSGGEATLASVLNSSGMSRAVDETYAVSTYITSRDMVARLEAERGLREFLSRSEGDFIYRFPNFWSRDNAEQLYKAFQRFVDVSVDSSTGITTLRTMGFRPGDAQNLSTNIVEFADAFINKLNERAHADAIASAQGLLREANARFAAAEKRLAEFRNREMIVDPEKESGASIQMIAALSTEIAKLEANLAQQTALTPNSPILAPMREKIRSLRNEYEKQRSFVAGAGNSIASKLEGFERLALERELGAKGLGLAQFEVEKARQAAQSQRIYLQTIVAANKAEQPARPLRLLSIMIVLGVALLLYSILKFLGDIILEHQA